MANDATITNTSRDFFSNASWIIPAGILVGGTYLWNQGVHRGRQPRGQKVSENDMSTGMLVTTAGLAAAMLYWLHSRKKTPIDTVQGLPPYAGPIVPR